MMTMAAMMMMMMHARLLLFSRSASMPIKSASQPARRLKDNNPLREWQK